MAVRPKSEARLLSMTERELVDMVRPKSLVDRSEAELKAIQLRLRAARDRARRIARTQAREIAGSTAPRRSKPARDNTGSVGKLEVLLKSLDGIAAELKRRKQPTQAEIAKKALAMKKAAAAAKLPPTRTSKKGLSPKTNPKAKKTVSGKRVGSTSAQGKRAQAKRDGR